MARKQTRRAVGVTVRSYDWITQEAKRRGISRSALLEEIIDGALKTKETKDRPPEPKPKPVSGSGYNEF